MLRRFTAFILSLLLVGSLFLVIMGLATQELLYPGIYESALDGNNAYELFSERLPLGIVVAGPPQEAIQDVIRRGLAYLRSDSDELDLRVPVDTEQTRAYYLAELESLRLCELGENPVESSCRPPGYTPEELLDIILIQENITLQEYVDLEPVFDPDGRAPLLREQIAALQWLILSAICLSILCILLLLFVWRGSMKKAIRVIDADLMVVGGNLLVGAFFVQYNLSAIIPTHFGVAGAVVTDILISLLQVMIIYGAIAFVCGLVLAVLSSMIDVRFE